MNKKDINIQSYDAEDAFYTGTDEEYEQFLKNADIKMNDGEEAEPVANTQRINLNETINIQGVIDRFRKTAGEIESGAKKLKDTVVSSLKAKREDEDEMQESASKEDFAPQSKAVNDRSSNVSSDISQLLRKLDDLNDKLNTIEKTGIANKGEQLNAFGSITSEMRSVGTEISDIKQSVASVSRLNDSVFDLKNTQLNTKNAIIELETSIRRLKKKCVLGVTVLSILSAIIIALEIILMLS